jgi:uncharacterized phiE125 gp8 family phage protein
MTALLIRPPVLEPITLVEAKAQLKIEHSTDDELISALIVAARVHLESTSRRVFVAQGWRLYRDTWPADGIVRLSVAPLVSVDRVTVYAADGTPHDLAGTDYLADLIGAPSRLMLKASTLTTAVRPINGIEIEVTAGYGLSGLDVPQPIRQALMMLVTRWYEGRDGLGAALVSDIPDAVEALIAPYRILRVA